ncbi:MAG TPA: endonuclease [Candidatus Fimimonas gallinarum]|uniref:Endonuclease n=1 Tax=Candidatus Fimimonas gallinarum TaxID=2840821 RepID=A0A9D1J7W5_9BACT|nr:endonuclease [Candidatus Fimimonas gallinarum]
MQKVRWKIVLSMLLVVALCLGFLPLLPNVQQQTALAETTWENTYTGSYYDNLNTDLEGSAFRAELAELITDTHTKYTSYSGLANAFKVADADPDNNGNVIWFYTGTSVPFSGFGGSVGATNREHVWPKDGGDAFPAESGPGSDAHHLRPTETQLNSTRGSKNFDEVAQTSANVVKENGSSGYGNSAYGADALCYSSGSFFYPAKGYRGATARILFYVQTRWGDHNLEFVDGAGSSKTIGKISTLLKWHLEEPPTEEEIRRNEAVFGLQGNRNPFIDHPEYAAQIYCYDGESYNNALQQVLAESDDPYGNLNTAVLESLSISPSTVTISVGDTYALTAVPTPSNARANASWTSSDNTVATVSDSGVVTAKSQGTVTITARNKDDASIYATARVTVKQVTDITISGAPVKTAYFEGDTFDPTGLTILATFSDGTSENLPPNTCTWLDGTTLSATLTAGTTSVVCKYGNITKTVTGITVTVDYGDAIPVDMNNLQENVAYKLVIDQEGLGKTLYIQNKVASSYYMASTEDIDSADDVYVEKVTGGFRLYFKNGSSKNYLNAEVSGTHVNLVSKTTATTVWTYDSANKCIKTTVTVSGSNVEYYIGTYGTYNTFSTSAIKHVSNSYPAYLATKNNGGGTVTPPVTDSVTLDKTSITLNVGDTATLVATATGTVTWTTSDNSVVTVVNGKLTAVGAGTATVTATCGTAKATCTVTVTKVVQQATAEQFIAAVDAVSASTTQQTKFNAIKNALEVYEQLSSDVKTEVANYNLILQTAIRDYNTSVGSQNSEMLSALKTLATLTAAMSFAVMAAAVLFKRNLL